MIATPCTVPTREQILRVAKTLGGAVELGVELAVLAFEMYVGDEEDLRVGRRYYALEALKSAKVSRN